VTGIAGVTGTLRGGRVGGAAFGGRVRCVLQAVSASKTAQSIAAKAAMHRDVRVPR
jgi:hypothetical protein